MKYCLVFPHVHVLDPIDFPELSLYPFHYYAGQPTSLETRVVDHIPSIVGIHLGYTPAGFMVGFIERDKPMPDVLSELLSLILLMRFCLLQDDMFADYETTEFILLRPFDPSDTTEPLHYEVMVNGLEYSTSFSLENQTRLEDVVPSSQLITGVVPGLLKRLRELESEQVDRVRSGIQRYILAHAPARHTDDFGRIINLVSGIECFLDLAPREGAKEFGQKLRERFDIVELQEWGRDVFRLRSDFAHQNIDILTPTMKDDPAGKPLWHKNSSETITHTSHYQIGRKVLSELIVASVNSGSPNSTDIEKLLYCNELPVRRILKKIGEDTPLGEEYYDLFQEVRENKVGGTLSEKRRVLRFVIRGLSQLYPDIDIFDIDGLNSNDPQIVLTAIGRVHSWLHQQHSRPITVENLKELTLISNVERLIWNLQMPFISDLTDAARNSNK